MRRRSSSGSLSRFGASVFRRSIGTTGASLFDRGWGARKTRLDPHAARVIHARFPRLPNRVKGSPGRRGRGRGRVSRHDLREAFFLAPFTTCFSSPDRAGVPGELAEEYLVAHLTRPAGEWPARQKPNFGHPAARLFFQTADGEQKRYYEARFFATNSRSEERLNSLFSSAFPPSPAKLPRALSRTAEPPAKAGPRRAAYM